MAGASAGALTFAGLGGLAVTAAPAHATAAVTLTTLAGTDRYQSAGNVNAKAFAAGVNEVVLADGLPGHQGDALAAAGYAGVNGYGILLTDNTTSVPANTLTALTTLKVKTIQPVGGTAAISTAELSQLSAAGYTVLPTLAGATSLDTMQAIDDAIPTAKVGTSGSPSLKTAILASVDENHLVDALSASGMSFGKDFPVITTESSGTALSPEATQVIGALGIQKLIVVGGTASIPASQYTPDPTGVTSEDISATTGADRSATSELLEKDEVANYGASDTQLAIAAGATFVGTTTAIQNDGADALASAPFTGGFMPLCVTDGPTNAGSVAQCGTDLAATLTNIYALTGTANLPTTQLTAVCTAAGGTCSTSSTTSAYTVSGGSLTLAASTAAAPSQGATTYTVTGLPTAAGTVAEVALFPIAGATKSACGIGASNGGPITASGATTFTPPCAGSTPEAGSALGEGISTLAPGCSSGTVAADTASAYVASVNGVPTTNCGSGAGATEVFGTAVTGGTLSFVVNSFQLAGVVPVVYTDPTGSAANAPILVTAAGVPQAGYAFGVGGISAWSAPAAPSLANGEDYITEVVLAPPLSGTNAFDALVLGCGDPGAVACSNGVAAFSILNFSYSAGALYYTDGTPETTTTFSSYLSGLATGIDEPNSTTLFQGTNNAAAGGLNGDFVYVGSTNGATVTGYASGAPSDNFSYGGAGTFGDVPAAATSPTASFNGCAFTLLTVCQAGVVVSWTPPANPDVSGSEALAGYVAPTAPVGPTIADNATYEVWASLDTSGTLAAATPIGHVAVAPTSSNYNNGDGQPADCGTVANVVGTNTVVAGCTSIAAPEFIWTNAIAGDTYVFYVTATADTNSGGNGDSASGAATNFGPFSAATTPVAAGSSTTTTPVIDSVAITAGTTAACAYVVGTFTDCGYTGVAVGGAQGYAIVTYSQNVTCGAAGSAFSYSNTGGTGAVAGAACADNAEGVDAVSTLTPAANQLEIDFPLVYASGTNSTGGPLYHAENLTQPGTGDTFTYTVPATQTTSNSVYVTGTVSSPDYAATQTVTDNGVPTADTNSGSTTSPSNPLY